MKPKTKTGTTRTPSQTRMETETMTTTYRDCPEGKERFHPINVSPFATNALDLVGMEDLKTRQGSKVTVRRSNGDFIIQYTTQTGVVAEYRTNDNLAASRILNTVEDGVGQFAI